MSVGWIVVSFFSMFAVTLPESREYGLSLGSNDCRLWHGRDRLGNPHKWWTLFLGGDSRSTGTRSVCVLDHRLVRTRAISQL